MYSTEADVYCAFGKDSIGFISCLCLDVKYSQIKDTLSISSADVETYCQS